MRAWWRRYRPAAKFYLLLGAVGAFVLAWFEPWYVVVGVGLGGPAVLTLVTWLENVRYGEDADHVVVTCPECHGTGRVRRER